MKYVFGLIALIISFNVSAQAISVCWERPTQRVDGSPFSVEETLRFEVEQIVKGISTIHTVKPSNTEFETVITEFGETCFRVRVFDTNELSSAWTLPECMIIIAPPVMINFRQCPVAEDN